MFDIKRLQKISGLNEAGIRQMDDIQFNSFNATVSSFIDNYPSSEESTKTALKSDDRAALKKLLAGIGDTLRQIHAEKSASACAQLLDGIDNAQFDDMQANVIEFLKDVSALSIDLQMAEYQDAAKPAPGSDPESAATNTILAVDDRHFFLTAIKTMLQDTGYKVTCINSGESALNYLKNQRPALFILDIEMPGMDGYELAGRIRASGQLAPIIFLTGNAKKEYVVKAIQAGAADFLIKPVNKEQLLGRIGKYIQPEQVDEE